MLIQNNSCIPKNINSKLDFFKINVTKIPLVCLDLLLWEKTNLSFAVNKNDVQQVFADYFWVTLGCRKLPPCHLHFDILQELETQVR